jgi:hypothetical protein
MRFSKITVSVAALLSLFALTVTTPSFANQKSKKITISATITSVDNNLFDLPGGIRYGWNHLQGPTTWGSSAAALDVLGDLRYTNGSGPFNLYVTMTRADGVILAVHIAGKSVAKIDAQGGTTAKFTGTVKVIGGNASYEGATGTGTMTGSRAAALGSPVKLNLKMDVAKK